MAMLAVKVDFMNSEGKTLPHKQWRLITKNLKYLFVKSKESELSLRSKMGISRATIHNIFNDKATTVRQLTIVRAAAFFGIPCASIESIDLESEQKMDDDESVAGNKNPKAAPVIPFSELQGALSKPVGLLIKEYPITYFYGPENNVISILVDRYAGRFFKTGSQLIINRSNFNIIERPALILDASQSLKLKHPEKITILTQQLSHEYEIIGYLIKELHCI